MKNFRFEIGDALLPGGKLYELFADAIEAGVADISDNKILLYMFGRQHYLFYSKIDANGVTVEDYVMHDFVWLTPVVNLIEDIAKLKVNPEAIMNNEEIIEFKGFLEDFSMARLRDVHKHGIFKRAPYYIMVAPDCVSVKQYINNVAGPETVIDLSNRLYKNVQLAKRFRENIGPCKAKLKLICDKIRKIKQVEKL